MPKGTDPHIRIKLIELCVQGRKNDPVSSLTVIYHQMKEQIPEEHRLSSPIIPE